MCPLKFWTPSWLSTNQWHDLTFYRFACIILKPVISFGCYGLIWKPPPPKKKEGKVDFYIPSKIGFLYFNISNMNHSRIIWKYFQFHQWFPFILLVGHIRTLFFFFILDGLQKIRIKWLLLWFRKVFEFLSSKTLFKRSRILGYIHCDETWIFLKE